MPTDVMTEVSDAFHKKGNFLVQDVLTSLPFLVSDLLAITIAWLCSSLLNTVLFQNAGFPDFAWLVAALISVPMALLLMGTYPGVNTDSTRELRNVFIATTIVSLCILVYFIRHQSVDFAFVAAEDGLFFASLLMLVPLGRAVIRKFGATCMWWRQPTLIIGSDAEVARIADWLDDSPELGLRPICRRELFHYDDIHPSRVICTSTSGSLDRLWQFPRAAVLSSDDVFRASTATERVAALSSMEHQNHLLNPFNLILKRTMDLGIALCTFVVTLPILLIVAVMVKLTSKGPIIHKNVRCGLDGRSFSIWKFRTMHADAERVLQEHLAESDEIRREWEEHRKLRDDPRITPVGRWLRKTSLDELPQLWNIVKGDMSLVGPRPILMDECKKYSDVFPLYTMVRPGVTGLWQISGRNHTTYNERLSYCRYYVQNW
ncbi:MAG: hypothetical protein HKN47_00600, partial [Pirellulaceae bacterium]|nr:hypothetical protein [Pirellulaceae bacterium]